MSSQPNSLSRALVSRILFGVTSIGAALGIMYIVYLKQKKKEPPPDLNSTSSLSRKKKRVISGERNRVTFSDQNEIIVTSPSPPPLLSKDEMEEDNLVSKQHESCPNQDAKAEPPPKSITKTESDSDISESSTIKDSPSPLPPPLDDVNDSSKSETAPVLAVAEDIVKPVSVSQSQSHSTENGHTLKQAITPETDHDRGTIIRELLINRDHVPGLIGKKGANIRAIQHDSNTIITFKDESLENGDRVCIIRGQLQDITVAESLIEKHIMEQPVITSQTMYVPHSSVGRIIGKGGESIRGIQDLSKAKVNVDTTNQFHNRGGSDSIRMVLVTVRGTEDQINCAKQMIIEKVEEEKALRRNIDIITQNRAPRRPPSTSTSSSTSSNSSPAVNGNHSTNGILEVFVSCAYHPNDFWVQVMGRESIDLDKLTETMTEWYSQFPPEPLSLSVGEIIAAPFDVDGKMYRGKILKLEEDMSAEVSYVDYGDKRVINQSDIRRIHPEFLKLRFQAIQATLNLGCSGERWSDDTIATFCDLTYCAQWRSLTAKVKDYLKALSDSRETVLFVELLDKDLNIGNELIKRGLAITNDSVPLTYSDMFSTVSSSSNNSHKKSYASVVSDENKSGGGDAKEEAWDDNVNGN